MEEKREFEECINKVLQLAKDKRFKEIREELLSYNYADIGEILEEVLEDVGINETIIIFRLLPKDTSVEDY